jgi:hypothetical protein
MQTLSKENFNSATSGKTISFSRLLKPFDAKKTDPLMLLM